MICDNCINNEICKVTDFILNNKYVKLEPTFCRKYNEGTNVTNTQSQKIFDPRLYDINPNTGMPVRKDFSKPKPKPEKKNYIECPECGTKVEDTEIYICSKCGKKCCPNCATMDGTNILCDKCWEE